MNIEFTYLKWNNGFMRRSEVFDGMNPTFPGKPIK